tara:strand:- start:23 stop:1360 length:1338 start_codon:yes stop_codon:yes gene_type:complete
MTTHSILSYLLLASFPYTVTTQALWYDQRYTAPYPHTANRPDAAIETSTSYGLGVYRRPAEAVSIGAEAAARQESDRLTAAPTLIEVLGSSLDGRTIDGLTINGKQIRNNTDLSSSSFRSIQGSITHSPSLSGAGRLNSSIPWIPAQQTPYEYIQVKFPYSTLIAHVSTRGGGKYGGWVNTFKVSTSMGNDEWKWYSPGGNPNADAHIFVANTDEDTVVRHQLFGSFSIQSVYGSGGRAQIGNKAPVLARMFRIYPLTWNATLLTDKKIAMRFDILRRVECGDGVWDEMNEGCEDGNVISGDGCSGTSGEWRGTSGPCQPEVSGYTFDNTKPQRSLNGIDSGHTVEQYNVPPYPTQLSQWCHPGSDCYDCASQRVDSPAMKFDKATQEKYKDPAYRPHCKGRRSRAEVNGLSLPDRPPVPDLGYTYRTTEIQAKGPVLYPNVPRL